MKTYKAPLENLPNNGIFVFGANQEGRHGKGSAATAVKKYGAVYGQAFGLQGRSFGIVTKDLRKKIHPSVSRTEIVYQIGQLYSHALQTPQKLYYVPYTASSSNLNNYTPNEMASMFGSCEIPDNIVFEEEFAKMVKESQNTKTLYEFSKQLDAYDLNPLCNKETPRFDLDATTIPQALNYIINKAIQLLRFGYKLIELEDKDSYVSALFEKEGEKYQSIYILQQFRGRGIYKSAVRHKILTSTECNISSYLEKNSIEHLVVDNIYEMHEYRMICSHYGDQKARRSKQYLINHIDEGLAILEHLNASEIAKKAFCLHPLFQGDIDLGKAYNMDLSGISPQVLISTLEYRSVANEYLSLRNILNPDEIRLSPLKDVNDMLVADKVQNYKDFELYHRGIHPRSAQLEVYFTNWFQKLNVSYEELKNIIL